MSTRVRKHANPFHLRVEVGRLDRLDRFGREGPLEIELGSGGGGFLLERAKNQPELDFVGFEVRGVLVERANELARERGLRNLLFLHANANTNLAGLIDPGVVRLFHVHFPDPWFKKRHMKRRVVRPELVRTMAELLPIGGAIYAQSDLRALAEELFALFSAEAALAPRLPADLIAPRPIAEATEWERHHEQAGEPIYRMWFEKLQEPEGPVRPKIPRRFDRNG